MTTGHSFIFRISCMTRPRKQLARSPNTPNISAHLTCEARNICTTDVCLAYEEVNVTMATRGQSKNSVLFHYRWHEERKFRVTSSSAHSIHVRQKHFTDLSRQMARRPFSTAATRYGMKDKCHNDKSQ
ncbi:unnamed protein product [Ixodes hexagonus]